MYCLLFSVYTKGVKVLISKLAKHESEKSMSCISPEQRCLIVVDPEHKLGFCKSTSTSTR